MVARKYPQLTKNKPDRLGAQTVLPVLAKVLDMRRCLVITNVYFVCIINNLKTRRYCQ